ncbi:MAG: TIR domain-containing protein [Candidatus Eremiobacteraeota bacterium]|nr:TIR domain-containing protein [Candidatus Eremiobacteraeota bacterium]
MSSLTKRVFIAFAVEDTTQRDFLVGQARNEKSPFEFVDMSVKEPWDEEWKKKCRSRIKGCNGVVALISKNTANATGEKFEIKCAIEEGVPIIGLYAYANDRSPAPTELGSNKVISWTWDGIKKFIDGL